MKKDEKAPGAGDAPLEQVYIRNEFYREGYRLLAKIVVALGAACVAALIAAAVAVWREPAPAVIAVTEDGRIIPLTPLGSPMLSEAQLLDWTTAAVTGALTFDFQTWRKVLTDMRGSFTAGGYDQFLNALKQAGIVAAVVKQRLVVSAVPSAAPVILAEGKLSGRYAWKMQIPLLVTYQASNSQQTQRTLVTVLVVRSDPVSHPHGVAIEQFVEVNKE